MSISSTDKVADTDKTSLPEHQAATSIPGENSTPKNSLKVDENQQGMVPLQLDSSKAPTESTLQLYQPAPLIGNRPISASNIELYGTFRDCGVRPIGSSHLEGSETFKDSGLRPITPSHLHVSKTFKDAGLRPVASNETDNAQGFIDYID